MRFGIHYRIRDARPLHQCRVVHLAEVETTFKQSHHMFVHLLFGDKSLSNSLRNASIGIAIATFHVGARQGSLGRGVDRRAQYLLQQSATATARVVVESLVGTHHLPHLRLLYQSLESRHVSLPEVARRHIREVGAMARIFGSAVHGIVLGTCPKFAVFRRLRALQSPHHLRSHDRGKIGILAIRLLSPSPSWVAEDIDIGSPDREAVEFLILSPIEHTMIVLGTKFGACSIEDLVEQIGIERRSHGDGFGEHSDIPHVGSPVERLTPPEKLLDAHSRNGRALVEHELGFFFQSQSRT